MIEKIMTLFPEIAMLITAGLCLIVGLSKAMILRKATPVIAALGLIVAAALACKDMLHNVDGTFALVVTFTGFVKLAVSIVGLLLLLIASQVPDNIIATRDAELAARNKQPFDPTYSIRGEFFAFFLISLTGVMLTAGADDLAWLFLALELTSLPTYIMIATTKDQTEAREASVKYFFLGAFAAAVFLYGFSFIYGATGLTSFSEIADYIALNGTTPLMLTGIILAILGLTFKIAAVPMHLYAADVYQGANTPVTTFLSFVPKAAGFFALLILLNLFPDSTPLPRSIIYLLSIIAVATMTMGNALGLLQSNVKRTLAYSSIAHSGYMIIALLLLHQVTDDTQPGPLGNGAAAILFYLVTYALGSIASFGALSLLQTRSSESQTYDDISGLARSQPLIAAVLLIGVLSLLGFPLTAGFIGKIYLFGAAIQHEYILLVIIAVLNSAVSAAYYLRIAGICFFGQPNQHTTITTHRTPKFGVFLAMILIIAIGMTALGDQLAKYTSTAANDLVNHHNSQTVYAD